jgi:hypothetical protein
MTAAPGIIVPAPGIVVETPSMAPATVTRHPGPPGGPRGAQLRVAAPRGNRVNP